MKKFIVLILLFLSINVFSQNTESELESALEESTILLEQAFRM